MISYYWYMYLQISHSVIPVEQSGGDEIRHHHVHTVVLMGHQDTHDTHSSR